MKPYLAFILLVLTQEAAMCSELKTAQDVINLWHKNISQGTNTITDGKLLYGYENNELSKIIADQVSDSNRDLIISDVLNQDANADGMQALYSIYVSYYLSHGDRQRLVGLLAKRCYENVGGHWVEFNICYFGRESLTNAFGVFFEAYEKSESAQAKDTICKAVRRALTTYDIDHGYSDDQFMAIAKTWEEAKWHTFKPNSDYEISTWGRPTGGLFDSGSEIKTDSN
jgi:hypothetical protein